MTANAMVNLTSSDGTTAQAGLGDTYFSNGTQYQYFLADGAIAAYALCSVQDDFDAQEATTTTVTNTKPISLCVPQFAVADNEYFWAPIGPTAPTSWDNSTTFKVLAANASPAVKMYTTATPGVIDDASTNGFIEGLELLASVTTQAATPFMAVQKLVANCYL